MKKAKVVEVPDRNLTFDEYLDLLNHANNSSLWYATNYPRNTNYIREKLYAKGYPKGKSTYVDKEGNLQKIDFVESCIKRVIDLALIDDEEYARNVFNSLLNRGKGISLIRFSLREKKVDADLIEKIVSEFDNDEKIIEVVNKSAERIKRSSAYKRQDTDFKKEQRINQGLISKGFSFDDISLWRESLEE